MSYLVLQTENGRAYEVIDGQQRITTITLIIIAILNRIQAFIKNDENTEDNKARRNLIHERYLGVKDVLTLSTSPKIILNRNNKKHFQDIIDYPYDIPRKRGLTKSNRRLNATLEFFIKEIKNYSIEKLVNLENAIADGLVFTSITVKDDLEAYLIFETLNSRGMHLASSDLLKNYLLSCLSGIKAEGGIDYIELFDEKWTDILEQLGGTNFTSFLRSFEGMYAPLQNPDDPFWRDYDDGKYTECTDNLSTLRLFNIQTPLSLFMAAYNEFDLQNFMKVLRCIVVISIRYNVICNKMPNEQEKIYNNVAIKIMKKEYKQIDDVKSSIMSIYPDDKEFTNAFSRKQMPNRQSSKKILYLLEEIECYISEGRSKAKNLSVEHVLPRNPDMAWQEYFGLSTYNDGIDRLGNMALLSPQKNQELGQSTYAEKRKVLKDLWIIWD